MEISVKSYFSTEDFKRETKRQINNLKSFFERAKGDEGDIIAELKIGDHNIGYLKAHSDGYERLDIEAYSYYEDFKYLKEFEVEYWDGDKAIELGKNEEFLLELKEYLANDLEKEAIAFVQGTRLYKRYKSIFG